MEGIPGGKKLDERYFPLQISTIPKPIFKNLTGKKQSYIAAEGLSNYLLNKTLVKTRILVNKLYHP